MSSLRQGLGSRLWAFGSRLSAFGFRLSVFGCRFSAVGSSLLSVSLAVALALWGKALDALKAGTRLLKIHALFNSRSSFFNNLRA